MEKNQANEILETNRATYNEVAGAFAGTRSFVWPDINFLTEYIKNGDWVLDVGCGHGRLREFIMSKGAQYLGVDYSENLIAEARNNCPEGKFLVANILNFEPEQKFDAVISVSVLNHFPVELQAEVIQRIKNLLKLGGYLLVINWNLWNIRRKKSVWRLPHLGSLKNVLTTWQTGDGQKKGNLFYYAFIKRDLRRLLEGQGFSVIQNFYSKKGKKSNFWFGENIVTVARLIK